jgi:hypothetical protein
LEGDADAAILEADAMRQAQKEAVTAEAGRVEAEKAAAAGEKLTWKEWVDKNYPEGRGSKRQQTLINEYNKYKKDIIEEGVATYKDPGIPYKPITLASKVFRRSLQNIKHAAPQAGGRLERFVDLWDTKKADWIEDFKTTRKQIRKEKLDEESIIKYLDGQIEETALSEAERIAAREIRKVLDTIAAEAKQVDVASISDEGYEVLMPKGRKSYFPHYFEAAGGKKPGDISTKIPPGRGKTEVHLEKHRTSKRKDWVKNLDVLEKYADQTARRISESVMLGKKHEKLWEDFAKYADIDTSQNIWLKKAIRQITQGPEVRTAGKLESGFRLATAWMDLPLAAFYQPGQITSTIVKGGLKSSGKALGKLLTDPGFRRAMQKGAAKSGATLPDVIQELAGVVKGRRGRISKFFKGKLWGIPTADKAMRIHAYAVGDVLLKYAKKGDKGARKLIDQLGFEDMSLSSLDTPMVGRKLSDVTQFRTGPAEKPFWASETGWGRIAYQYQHFAYQWGNLVGDIYKTQGPKGMGKLLIAGGLIGEAIGDIRSIFKGFGLEDEELGERYEKGDIKGYFNAITNRSKRFPFDHPLHRALQNFFMVGGLGIFFERFADLALRPAEIGDVGTVFPAARRPTELATAAAKAVVDRDVEPIKEAIPGLLPGGFGYSGWAKWLEEEENARVGGRRKKKSQSRVGGRR